MEFNPGFILLPFGIVFLVGVVFFWQKMVLLRKVRRSVERLGERNARIGQGIGAVVMMGLGVYFLIDPPKPKSGRSDGSSETASGTAAATPLPAASSNAPAASRADQVAQPVGSAASGGNRGAAGNAFSPPIGGVPDFGVPPTGLSAQPGLPPEFDPARRMPVGIPQPGSIPAPPGPGNNLPPQVGRPVGAPVGIPGNVPVRPM